MRQSVLRVFPYRRMTSKFRVLFSKLLKTIPDHHRNHHVRAIYHLLDVFCSLVCDPMSAPTLPELPSLITEGLLSLAAPSLRGTHGDACSLLLRRWGSLKPFELRARFADLLCGIARCGLRSHPLQRAGVSICASETQIWRVSRNTPRDRFQSLARWWVMEGTVLIEQEYGVSNKALAFLKAFVGSLMIHNSSSASLLLLDYLQILYLRTSFSLQYLDRIF